MSTSLSEIVKRLTGDEVGKSPRRGEVRLIYDARNKAFLEREPRLSWGRDIHHYRVNPGRLVKGVGPSVLLQELNTSNSFELEIVFETWCHERQAETLVAALHNEESMRLVVDQLIEDEISAFYLRCREDGQDLALGFYELKNDLEQAIQVAAESSLGLVLKPTVNPRLEGKIEKVSIRTGVIEARPKGFKEVLEFECSAEIQAIADQTTAFLTYLETKDLPERFRKILVEAVQREITLDDLAQTVLCAGNDGEESNVERKIVRMLNENLSGIGREITFLSLSVPESLDPAVIQIEFGQRCGIQDRADPIAVRHRFRASPADYSRIVQSKIKDPVQWLKEKIGDCADSVLIQRKYVDLYENAAKKEIEERVRKVTSDIGYQLEVLITEIELEKHKAEPFPLDYTASYPIKDSEQDVTVRHRLFVEPIDLSRIRRAGIADPKVWIRERLDRETRKEFIEKNYLDLLLRFDPVKENIKVRLTERVNRSGYAVQHLVSIPDLEPLTWKNGLSVECGQKEFSTGDSRIRVGLEIVVNGRIEDLEDPRLKNYLGPQNSQIYSDISAEAVAAVRRVMHEIDPQSFYLEFGDGGVAERLEKSAKQALTERFGIREIDVILKPLETELTKRIQYLVRGPHKVEVECFPLRSGGRAEEVMITISFDILGVADGCWVRFCSRSFASPSEELREIKEQLSKEIYSRIGTLPEHYTRYHSREGQVLLAKVLAPIVDPVRDSFGLEIRLYDVFRSATFGEQKNSEVLRHDIEEGAKQGRLMTSKFYAAADSRLTSFLAKEQKMLLAGYEEDDPELEGLRKQIREMKEEVLPYRSREERVHVPLLESESVDISVDAYLKDLLPSTPRRALAEPRAPKQLEAEISDEAEE